MSRQMGRSKEHSRYPTFKTRGPERLEDRRLLAVNYSEFAYYGDAGRLLHPLDDQGNRILDFSTAGYRNGNVPLPDVAATIPAANIVTVSPGAGDDLAAIQAAIAQVAAMPRAANGYRGAVQLTAGEFQIATQIVIQNDGIILRGVGDGDNPASNTILRGTGTTVRSLIVVGASSNSIAAVSGTTHSIVDKYVPTGATSLRVDSTANWSVGDQIVVRRGSNAQWIAAIGMDSIPPRSDGGTIVQWAPASYEQTYERVITRIEGDRVFFNAPIANSIEQQYGGGTVYRYTISRTKFVGIENIRGVSDFTSATDEAHTNTFIELRAVEDAWVRNVTGQHFIFATVHASTRAMRATVDDAQSLDPVSIITGGRRYAFTIDGQFILMQNLFSEEGRHDFVNNSPSRNRGPNAFVNGTAVNSHSTSGPHQRWSTGTLYDNLSDNGGFESRNRGNFGTGHGWAGANMVFWNSSASQFTVQNPPTSQNWVIGSSGTIVNETLFGPQPQGTYDSHGKRIDFDDPNNPLNSLYVAQHQQRLSQPWMRREYAYGDFDLGVQDGAGSVDAPQVDPAWLAQASVIAQSGSSTIAGYDSNTPNSLVPLSLGFNLDSNDVVRAATLSVGLRDTAGNSTNDQVWWESSNNVRSLASWLDGQVLGTNQTTSVMIELTGSDLADLQDGKLNLIFGNDTLVDWAVLDLAIENLTEFDMGDAPLTYLTSLSQNGARHGATGPRLGNLRDQESDASPNTDASGDGNDEDGVLFGNLFPGSPAGINLDLQNANAAKVDAWVDFDADGVFQSDEQILNDANLIAGLQTLNYSLPNDAVSGETFARVRVSSRGVAHPFGFAFDGEVEDLKVIIGSPTPQVVSVKVNGENSQRSAVTEVAVVFDREVTLAPSAVSIIDRATSQQVENLVVQSSVLNERTIATITFAAGALVAAGTNSLVNGNYELRITSNGVTSVGNGQAMSSSLVFGDSPTDKFFRKYGDVNGNGIVELSDFAAFRAAFGASVGNSLFRSHLDHDGNGVIALSDFARFRSAFGT
jgi:GEVED domain